MNIWATMSQIDIRKFTEKKNGFTYLSWAHALRLLKDHVPNAIVVKHQFKQPDGSLLPMMLDSQGYAYVQVTVHLGEGEVNTTEIMPVLNHANKPIQNPNSFEVNAQIQRCMAKAISMATGLGIHLYAGEDMPAPVSARPDNSGSTAVRGATSGNSALRIDDNNQPSGVAPPSNFKSPALTLEQEIALCPDIEALKSLYNRVERGLSPEDRQKFSNRKQELANG
jgi:hypothetical protein